MSNVTTGEAIRSSLAFAPLYYANPRSANASAIAHGDTRTKSVSASLFSSRKKMYSPASFPAEAGVSRLEAAEGEL